MGNNNTIADDMTSNKLTLTWRQRPIKTIFGWGLRSDQPWLEHSTGPAGYEIRHKPFGPRYSVSWWHGNQAHPLGYTNTIGEAKELAQKHLETMLRGIYQTNKVQTNDIKIHE